MNWRWRLLILVLGGGVILCARMALGWNSFWAVAAGAVVVVLSHLLHYYRISSAHEAAYRALDREISEIQQIIVSATEQEPNRAAAVEEACFCIHAISRLAFRKEDDRLRTMIVDSCANYVAERLPCCIVDASSDEVLSASKSGFIALLNERELEYTAADHLLSEHGPFDRDSVIRLAAFRVADALGIPHDDIAVVPISTMLMRKLVAMDLAHRIERIEANL